MRPLFTIILLLVASPALAQTWQQATDGRFVVETASPADRERLPEVFEVLQDAARDLRRDWSLTLPRTVTVRVYPTLAAYMDATHQPWYVAATADRNAQMLHLQRLRVLSERGTAERTLRHELFHLAQSEGWARWRAEGSAMRFADETPTARPFKNLSSAELNRRLAEASSRTELARAAATAWLWVSHPKFSGPDLSSVPRRSSSP